VIKSVLWAGVLLACAGPVVAAEQGHFAVLNKYCDDCHNATDWAGG